MNIALAQLIEAELENIEIKKVEITDDSVIIDLQDGRTIITPLLWYPRLSFATAQERTKFEVRRNVIRWPELDEELSVRGMLLGRKSGESPASLQRWLAQRDPALTNR